MTEIHAVVSPLNRDMLNMRSDPAYQKVFLFIAILVVIDVIISTVLGHTMFFYLIELGMENSKASIISTVIGAIVYCYIVFHYKITEYIRTE